MEMCVKTVCCESETILHIYIHLTLHLGKMGVDVTDLVHFLGHLGSRLTKCNGENTDTDQKEGFGMQVVLVLLRYSVWLYLLYLSR